MTSDAWSCLSMENLCARVAGRNGRDLTTMTTIAYTPSARRTVTGLCAVLAVTLLSGCSGGGVGSSTAQGRAASATSKTTVPSDTPVTRSVPTAKSDVLGRSFDLGTIVRVEDDGPVPVIIFDRWTARGVADSTLAAKGVPVSVRADAPYQNLNSKITYRIPVAQGALFTYRHCVATGQPAEQKSSTLEDFTRLPNPENVVLLTLDQHGRVFSAQNEPTC